MSTINIIPYTEDHRHEALADFEEILQYMTFRYSMLHLIEEGITSREHFIDALQKAIRVCNHAGIPIDLHFKQVYSYDAATGELDTDWLMSKRGLKLIILQYPEPSRHMSRWLWQWSEI